MKKVAMRRMRTQSGKLEQFLVELVLKLRHFRATPLKIY